MDKLARLKRYLAEAGITAIGADENHGAFLAVQLGNAVDVSANLAERGIVSDARGEWLRLCPDCLTKDEELRLAASSLGQVIEQTLS
jgi:kynureninase